MPTSAPVTPDKVRALQAQYGGGPFGQLMMNLALAPTPQALIDLTGGPETWLKAIRNPINPDPEMPLLHGITSLPEKAIGKEGLKKGWFSNIAAEFFGPHYAEAKFKDLPQPVIAAPRVRSMIKYDPPVEFSPAWAGPETAKIGLDKIQRDLDSGYLRTYPRELLSSVKDVQHAIAMPSPVHRFSIAPEKLTYVNPLTGQRGPFLEAFQRLMEQGHSRMNPEEFKAFVEKLKKPF